MMTEAPPLEERDADQIVADVEQALAVHGWQGQAGGAGWALVRLFGRLAELAITRLNQVPDKHFLAFLNEAGVDLVPPRSASTELTFIPAEDGLPFIPVPAGTQVATVQTETQPEVIFETQRDILVAPNTLVKCVAFDPLNYSEHTAQATGSTFGSPLAPSGASFAAFRGEQERERILYLGDPVLFTFSDAASRQAAVITLHFEFDPPGDPAHDGWKLAWLYWDEEKWAELRTEMVDDLEAQVVDGTENFAQDGDVTLQHLPELIETEVDGQSGLWIACQLTGGGQRDHLPVIKSVKGSRSIEITESRAATDILGFSATQANTAFLPLDLEGDSFPLGQRPDRLDTFYLMSNEAFSKQGGTVKIQMAQLIGVPEDFDSADLDADIKAKRAVHLNDLTMVWEYHSTHGWTELGTSTRSSVSRKRLSFEDETLAFTKTSGEEETLSITFDVPPSEGGDPSFEEATVNDQAGLWIRARVTGGSYNVLAVVEILDKDLGTYELHEATTYTPLVKQLKVTYSGYTPSTIGPKPITFCRSRVDGMGRDHSPTFPLADAGQDRAVTAADDEATVQLDTVGSQASTDQSLVRYTWRLASSRLKQTFAPFCAAEEGPAFYLGFQQAFPAGKWIQLLLDVDEEKEPWQTNPTVFWEYWDSGRWIALRVSDGSRGLSERGYLGFFGPDDHGPRTEFGQHAYWLRARPPRAHPPPLAQAGEDRAFLVGGEEARITLDASDSRGFGCQSVTWYTWRLLPQAKAGDDQQVLAEDGEATVTLDALGSQAFDREKTVARYIWRLLSSNPPTADAGPDRTIATQGDEATVALDASGSGTAGGRSVVNYIWRRAAPESQEEEEEKKPVTTPYLKAVRVNTVPAVNAVTIGEEALGSSDGKPDQCFALLRPPVLPGAQIAVREPDRPPDDELAQLQRELQQVEEGAQALLPTPEATPGEGAWVRWHQVSDFYASTPASRHFALDPISGQVRFGDGKQGKIPPIGRDNIKAVLYCTYDGAKGNAAAGAVTVMRNPSGDLANIKSVTNPEAAAGGSDAETVGEVKRRGPQSRKHRQRAVTVEDFVWLALEASGEVAQSRCLPTRNREGLPEPGWVTVVITPESQDPKPTPSPALLRRVKGYLENHALANLEEADQIHVKGPEYIEATVLAHVKPVKPEKSDEIELAVLARLEGFLHPLKGGPERTGWELGRDVYLSEVCAEIEAVAGVDHVAGVRLLGSLQQHHLRLRKENGYREVPYDLPVGSQVSTFDERIKLLLAEPVFEKKDSDEALTSLAVYGFKVGDEVAIVEADNTVVKENLTVASLSGDTVAFDSPFVAPAGWDRRNALMSPEGNLRLPLVEDGITTDLDGQVTGVTVQGFKAGDKVSVVVGTRRDLALEFLPLEEVKTCEDRIFVPEGHLIYSGDHDIEMVLE